METASLDDLIGEFWLDAVDRDDTTLGILKELQQDEYSYAYRDYSNAEMFSFRLDGRVYVAIEDPDDGYRSSMEELLVSNGEMRNTFPPVRVVGRIRQAKADPIMDEPEDVVEFVCVDNDKVILAVGTDRSDSYYPCFISEFHPGDMPINEPNRKKSRGEEG